MKSNCDKTFSPARTGIFVGILCLNKNIYVHHYTFLPTIKLKFLEKLTLKVTKQNILLLSPEIPPLAAVKIILIALGNIFDSKITKILST